MTGQQQDGGYGRARRQAAVFVLAVCVRVAFQAAFVGMEAPPRDDASEYDSTAWSLASGGPYLAPDGFRSHRAPGYTVLLAGVYWILGHSWVAARLAQAVLGAATCLLIYRLGESLFGGSVGLVAGLAYAVDPYAVFWCGYLLSEPLCALLVAASVLALILADGRLAWTAVWACLSGLSALTRPNLGIMFPLGLLWLLRHPGGRSRRCALAVVIFCLTLLPWTARNYLVHHRFVAVTTMGGVVLWEGNNPYVAHDPRFRGHSAHAADLPEALQARGLSETEIDALYFRMALGYMRDHWSDMPELFLHKFLALWNLVPELDGRLQRWTASARMAVVITLSLAGLWVGWRRREPRLIPLLLPILTVTATALLYWGDARIRAPAEPMILLLGAYALSRRSGGPRESPGRRPDSARGLP